MGSVSSKINVELLIANTAIEGQDQSGEDKASGEGTDLQPINYSWKRASLKTRDFVIYILFLAPN